MHKMDDTPRIITIFALFLEGSAVFGITVAILFLNLSEGLNFFSAEKLEMTVSDFDNFMEIIKIGLLIFYIFVVIYFVIFIVNLFLFIPLIRGNCSSSKAKNIYLYEAIWGAINLLSNPLIGVLYLIAGVQGRSGHREEKNVREGI
jgi:hypothetical protein